MKYRQLWPVLKRTWARSTCNYTLPINRSFLAFLILALLITVCVAWVIDVSATGSREALNVSAGGAPRDSVLPSGEDGSVIEKQFAINVIDGSASLISFSSSNYSATETDGNTVITLTRTAPAGNEVVAKVKLTDVTTSPADYYATPGTLDTPFNPTCPGTIKGLAAQPDGKVLAVTTNSIARFNVDGSADPSFVPNTQAVISGGLVALQGDGKIFVGAYALSGNTRSPARLNTDGSLDTSFNPGLGPDGAITALVLQPDGKVIIAGSFTNYNSVGRKGIARTNADGLIDTSFDPGAGANGSITALALRPDGKIVIGGDFDRYQGLTRTRVALLQQNGEIDNSFFPINSPPILSSIGLQSDGRIVLGGLGVVTRMNPDGSVDSTFPAFSTKEFDSGVSYPGFIYQLVIQPDDKIIVGGLFQSVNQTQADNLVRLNSNGTMDTSFKPPIGSYGLEPPSHPPLGALALGSDGKIIVAGFRALNKIGRSCLARLNGDILVKWPAGDVSNKTFLLPIVDDGVPEPNETLTLSLEPLTGGAVAGAIPTATLTIINNHDKAATSISDLAGSGVYGGTATLTAKLTAGGAPLSGKAIDFFFSFTHRIATTDANGIATLINVPLTGYDPNTCQCPAWVPAGNNNLTASFAGDNDLLASSANGSAVISKAPSTTTVSSSLNPSTLGQTVTFTAKVTAVMTPAANQSTVQFSLDGASFGAPRPLDSNGMAEVSTDALTVGSHTISADFNPVGSDSNNLFPSTGTLTGGQVVKDQSMFNFSADHYQAGENDGFVTITVNRTAKLSNAVDVDYATDDSWATDPWTNNGFASSRCDFGAATGTLHFAPGETQKTFNVLVNRDSYTEGPETFTLKLTNPSDGATLTQPFTATATIGDMPADTPGNPLDDAQMFVRQHYHDFLNREADTAGLSFWTNEITQCGANAQCVEVRRVNVSASFVLSIEFKDTGYLVERLYRTSYGNLMGQSTFHGPHLIEVPIVRLDEFLADTQAIGNGVIVNAPNWQAQLELNKQSFIAGFVQHPRFTAAFPLSLSAAEFVDKLNANAGNPLSQSERDKLVTDLSTNQKTRAEVLRAVAEDPDLVSAELNRAFVLMEYFSYLRRNPNDAQDSDYTGYDFWLLKLDQANGNFIEAEMVKAFITSSEYRLRFGPY